MPVLTKHKTVVVCFVLLALVCLATAWTSMAPQSASPTDLKVAEGLEAAVFADSSMLVNPTNMDIDEQGRVWVIEALNYRPELNPENPTREDGDRILILEDTDGDGRADTREVYYQGTDIDAALGLAVLGDKVYVSRSPHVFVFEDTDGDDRPERRDTLFTGIGGEQHDHGVHAVVFGPDGKLYFNMGNEGQQVLGTDGDTVVTVSGHKVVADGTPYWQGMAFRSNLDGSAFEVLAHNFRNPYELTVDSYGTVWQSDNDDDGNRATRVNYVMEHGNFGRVDAATGAGWRARRIGMHSEVPKRHWHTNDPGVVPNLLLTGAGSPTGITVYEGDLLPDAFRGALLLADAAAPNEVRAHPITSAGAGYATSTTPVVRGTESGGFRPSDVAVAPDGSLFIADWWDPVVGGHQMEDLQRGRILRVAPPGTPYTTPAVDRSTAAGAVQALKNPNPTTRFLAWTKLHALQEQAEPALRDLWTTSDNSRYRARALWLLVKIEGRGRHYVEAGLQDANPDLRITALRAARQLGLDVLPYVRRLVDDPAPQVRREAALALRHDERPEAAVLWTELALQYEGTDRWYLEALGIGAEAQWDRFFTAWRERAGGDWNSDAGRDLVWRARTDAALSLLAELIKDPATGTAERERYFRAFHFHREADAGGGVLSTKQQVLLELVDTDLPDARQIRILALRQIEGVDPASHPALQSALEQTLDEVEGTRLFVELVQKYGVRGRSDVLLTMALSAPRSDSASAAVHAMHDLEATDRLVASARSREGQRADSALIALGYAGDDASKDVLASVLRDPATELERKRLAVRMFGRGWRGKDRLLALVQAGQLPEGVDSTAADVLSHAWRDHIREAAAQYFGTTATRETTLSPVSELVTRTGDAGHGEQIFARQCSMCHQVNGEGTDFGPDLSTIGSKLSKEGLYQAILQPSAGISFGYEGYVITLDDGTEAVGYIAGETGGELALRQAGGITTRYAQTAVTTRETMDVSLMPDGLERAMSESELVDLVAYLRTLR